MYITMIEMNNPTGTFVERKAEVLRMLNRMQQYETYGERAIHRMVCDMAGVRDRTDNGVLYYRAADDDRHIFIQTEHPLIPKKVEHYGYRIAEQVCKDIDMDTLQDGDYVMFQAKLVPSITVLCDDGRKRHRAIREEQQRLYWVQKRLSEIGTEPIAPSVTEMYSEKIEWVHTMTASGENTDRNKGGATARTYKGFLCVTDADKFREAVKAGLGRNKAYGCGMILVKNTGRKRA